MLGNISLMRASVHNNLFTTDKLNEDSLSFYARLRQMQNPLDMSSITAKSPNPTPTHITTPALFVTKSHTGKSYSVMRTVTRKRLQASNIPTSSKDEFYEPYELLAIFRLKVILQFLIYFSYALLMVNILHASLILKTASASESKMIKIGFYSGFGLTVVIKVLMLAFVRPELKCLTITYFFINMNFIVLYILSLQAVMDYYINANYFICMGTVYLLIMVYQVLSFHDFFQSIILAIASSSISVILLIVLEGNNDYKAIILGFALFVPSSFVINFEIYSLDPKRFNYFKKFNFFELSFVVLKLAAQRYLKKETEHKLYSISEFSCNYENSHIMTN